MAQVQVFGLGQIRRADSSGPEQARRPRQIGLNEIDNAIKNWNVNTPTGTLYGPHKTAAYDVQANGQLLRAADYKSLVVTYRNGAPVRLDEVANVIDSLEDDKNFFQDLRRASSVKTLCARRQPLDHAPAR